MENNKSTWLGATITLILVIAGIYVIFKHHKAAGFWMGVLAMFLLGSYVVTTTSGTKISTPMLSLDTNPQ